MTFQPLNDRILVRRDPEKEVMKSGFYIPDVAKERPQEGAVLAVGPGRITPEGRVIPLGVSVGDHVYFAKYSGTEVKVDDEDLLLLKEDDVLGKDSK